MKTYYYIPRPPRLSEWFGLGRSSLLAPDVIPTNRGALLVEPVLPQSKISFLRKTPECL